MLGIVHSLPVALILLVAAAILFVESGLLIGLVFPGMSTALALGFVTSPGNGDVPLAAACLTAMAATLAGAHHGYLRGRRRRAGKAAAKGRVGRWLGSPGWLARWLERLVADRRVTAALSLVDRHATLSIPVGHWIGVLRTLVPRAAGRGGVPFRKFSLCNAPAAAAWGATLVLTGHAAGGAFDRIQQALNLSGWLLLILIGAALVIVGRLRKRWMYRAVD